MMVDLIQPDFDYCFELRVAVDDPFQLGGHDHDGLHFAPIVGGTLSGPRLDGRILPGGGDWWVGRGMTVQLDARYNIEARLSGSSDETAAVEVVNRGYWRTDEATYERMLAGDEVDESRLYYRTAFTFRTDHPDLAWLCRSQFIGYARPAPGHVMIRVFRLV